MKKLFRLILLCTTICSFFIACSNDEDDDMLKEQSKNEILGSWNQVTVEKSDYVTMELEIIWTFNSNNTASQQVIASLNDYVFENVTNTYYYVYDGKSSITFTSANNKVWTYKIEVCGNKMELGNDEDGYFNLTRKN